MCFVDRVKKISLALVSYLFESSFIKSILARDLQTFLVFYQHPAWFIMTVNP
mgnify:CR=1 FL=1